MAAVSAPAPSGARYLLQPLARTRVRDCLLIAGGAALTALCAQVSIPVPGTPVPITGQTFAVMLVATSLGLRRGVASIGLYLLLGLIGVPVYSDASHGWHVITGATGGYLIGFLLAAAIMGWAAERGWDRTPLKALPVFLLGQLVIFGFGVPWLAVVAHLGPSAAVAAGFTPFIVGGLVKGALASALLPLAWRISGRN
jgi:biotin transport system substrate-specific component